MSNSTLIPGSHDSVGTGSDSAGVAGYPGTASSGMGQTGAGASHSTMDKVAEPAHETVHRVSAAAHETVDKLAGGAAQAAECLSDQARFMTETSSRALESSKIWVKGKPLEAVGMALALGFIMGRMTSR